jgi:GTPase
MDIRIPIVAIVGRPNVGKSTFFNRILGETRAVVEDLPGVTRDRNYGLVEAYRIPFYVVDTGGFEKDSVDELQQHTSRQALLAVEEADAIIFLVDTKAGLHPGDEEVIEVLRQYDKPFSVVANKCDGRELETLAAEFYQLGVDSVTPCSALHGRGVSMIVEGILETLPNFSRLYEYFEAQKEREKEIQAEIEEAWKQGSMEIAVAEDWYEEAEEDAREDMREKKVIEGLEEDFPPVYDPESGVAAKEYDETFAYLPLPQSGGRQESEDKDEPGEGFTPEVQDDPIPCIRLALIGRPNVGKSTILNALTGDERAITSPLAGTTRDSIHEVLTYEGQQFELIDTAGMRKKGRVGDRVEKYSVLRSMRAISECDVAVVVLDAVEGPSDQDAKILGIAHDEGKGIVLVVNKWDLIVKDHKSVKEFEEKLRMEFKFVPYAPIYFVSGKTGKRVNRILEAAKEVAHARKKRVSTMALNTLLRKELPRASTPSYRGRPLKLFYAAQVDVAPPRFMLVLNYPRQVHFSYLRFIKNTIRDRYGFHGTDIKLVTKKRSGGKRKKAA